MIVARVNVWKVRLCLASVNKRIRDAKELK